MDRDKKQVKLSTLIAVSGIAMIIGFIGGTRKEEVLNLLSPIFGIKKTASSLDLSSVQNTYRVLAEKFDGNLDTAKLIEGASKGLVEATGDEHTIYMDAAEAEEFNKSLSGDVGAGIGVQVGMRNNLPTVVRALKNNPAIKAGILAGDVIVEVNGESVSGKTID